ncbi:MAG: hypothetical protein LBJ86_07660 [Spirochaetaceae bacterium]|jgi:hypothetical protein|nr:hypothetical protein [Spirochaetaceae bacterium]
MKRILVYGIAVLFAFYGCEQLTENEAPVSQPKTAEVTGASGLKNAFADPGIKVIGIQGDIKAETLKLTVPAGDKAISIPGGKETAIGSLELSPGSHVKLMNGSGGTAKSVSGALAAAYSEQTYDGWATFVIWDHFKIPKDATFDLAGEVRLVFRVAEVEGTLKAEIEDSILGAGEEAPVIAGKGNVQTSRDAGAKKPELAAADIKNSDTHKVPPSGVSGPVAITVEDTGIMDKGGTRQFDANRTAVAWSVEGTLAKDLYNMDEDTKSDGTTISDTGLLTIAEDETNITLTVKAVSGEYTDTVTVKVKGWKTMKSAQEAFGANGISINGIAYGAGKWVAVGGTSGYSRIAYSTDGESWTPVAKQKLLPGNESINSVVYDGPEGGKKFIALARRVIYYSDDGVDWANATIEGEFPIYDLMFGPANVGFNGAAYGEGKFIAVAANTDGHPNIVAATSNDGISWTLQDISTEGEEVNLINSKGSIMLHGGFHIAYHNGKFIVALGYNAAIAETTNGADMKLVANTVIDSSTVPHNPPIEGLSIAAKGYPVNYVSDYLGIPSANRVIFTSEQWIVTGTGHFLAVSSNTTDWTPLPLDLDSGKFLPNTSLATAYGNGKLIIGNWKGNLAYTSLPLSAAPTWTFENIGEEVNMRAIAYGDNKFIVTGPQGKLFVAHEETLE